MSEPFNLDAHPFCELRDCPACPTSWQAGQCMEHAFLLEPNRPPEIECLVCGYYDGTERPKSAGEPLSASEALERIHRLLIAEGVSEDDWRHLDLLQSDSERLVSTDERARRLLTDAGLIDP